MSLHTMKRREDRELDVYGTVLTAFFILHRCYYDRYGRYRCSGLLGRTVAGIIVACVIPVLFALLLLCFCIRRRRASKRINESYATQQTENPQMYQQPSGSYPPYGEQAQPQQSYGYGNQSYGGPGQQGSFAPPPGPPPQGDYTQPPAGTPPPAEQMYPAPPGPPPAARVKNESGGESAAYYQRA
ncbi:hypothetical protein P389DRAFT_8373 [Cystobasidium minutum MCA 4210]|uniref:uncharacterized protein n=1 Tax=Cystobasidium minutum MCA 4210 TaxID=1397322 RepID=UPI0034CDEEC6|eukprot:jgi/Rhomi1/8373/CE8372_10695